MRTYCLLFIFLLLSYLGVHDAGALNAKPPVKQQIESLNAALVTAVENGDVTLTRQLLKEGGNIVVQGYDYRLLAPAAESGNNQIIHLLLAYGANINDLGAAGETALNAAAQEGHIQTIKLLIARGATLNNGARFGPPLQDAMGKGRLPVVKVLVKAGADVNGGGAYESVLQMAAAKADLPVMRYLIAHGANINQKTRWNRTPLMEAIKWHNTAIAALLIRHGAKVNERCELEGLGFLTGESVLHLAKRLGYSDLVKLLIKAGAKQ